MDLRGYFEARGKGGERKEKKGTEVIGQKKNWK